MPALSRDGKRLAFAKRGPYNVNLWQVGLTAPTRPSGPPEKLLSSSRFHGYAAFSPDGRRLAFTSDRSGSSEVWTSDGDGSNPVALTAFGELSIPVHRSGRRTDASSLSTLGSRGSQESTSSHPKGGGTGVSPQVWAIAP